MTAEGGWRTAMIAACVMLFAAFAGGARAEGVVNASAIDGVMDLAGSFSILETDKLSLPLTLPPDANGNAPVLILNARGNAAIHRWAIATLANPGQTPLELVIAVPHRGFAGSGVLWPLPFGTKLASILSSDGATLPVLNAPAEDTFVLALGAGRATTIALEFIEATPPGAMLWSRAAFEIHGETQSFSRGVVLGIAILLGLIMLSLYSVRRISAFPSGFIFALGTVLFIGLEAGYLPDANALMGPAFALGQEARAIVEAIMLAGLTLCLVSFPELRRRMPAMGHLLLALAATTVALIAYGFFEPFKAAGIARMGFAAIAVLGLAIILSLRAKGHARALASLPAWLILSIWTAAAAASATGLTPESIGKPALAAMLVLTTLTMAFALAQFAFSHGFLSRRFFEESGRRALALAGAQQYVWDWRVDDEELYVGEELEKIIGARPGFFAETGADGFADLLHPMDRAGYESSVINAEKRAKGAFSQDFRLRRSDGAYRWFQLNARVMPGPDGRPLRLIGTLADITANKRSEERLLSDAVYDRVTGLPNKALFLDRLERAMAAADAGKISGLHVLVLDLDRFKTVNDGLGHEAGDALLNATGRRLQAMAGPDDTVARLPGDQFALMFTGSSPVRDILPYTDQLRRAISRPIAIQPKEVFLTTSIGIAHYRERGRAPADILRDASVALYEAKRRGMETVEFFRDALRDDRNALVSLESDLRRAVERGEIEVAYQPIARLADMDLAGFEALVRWRHPVQGLLAPESFINLAEQTGLIREIGRFVLNDAARQLGVWQRAFRPGAPLFVAVNLSATQLMATGLAEEVKSVIAREGIRRGTLKIEVTESTVMENPELAGKILERLQAMGVGLACDDFGTGYSSLSNLRRLPFDTLKVDKSFVSPDAGDERAAVILEAILTLAHDLGLKVVAEGIETQEQVDRLGALRCDLGQGYFIGEPMTAKQVADALSGMPYAATKERTAIKALWQQAAAAPVELPPLPEPEEIDVPRAPDRPEPEPAPEPEPGQEPVEETIAELLPAAPEPEPEPVLETPRLGSAPMAPRLLRPVAEEPPAEAVKKLGQRLRKKGKKPAKKK